MYIVSGMIPIEDRANCKCAWCGTYKSVKYIVEDEVAHAGIPPYSDFCGDRAIVHLPRYFCCNKCVTRVATFVRVNKENTEKVLAEELPE